MKTKNIEPNEIITLNDYPIYSPKDLKKYYNKCINNKPIPLIPVIMKALVKKYLDKKLLKILKDFEKENSSVKYFMLDGTHRTTALTLANKKIPIIIYEKDEDIKEAKQMIKSGEISENATLFYNIIKNCEILNKHFNVRPYFMTVKQKTEKMVKEKVLPKTLFTK
jgi:predicted solute-binding protein